MVCNELCIIAMGAVVVSSVKYAYSIILLREIPEEFTEAALILLFQFRSRSHVGRKLLVHCRNKSRMKWGEMVNRCWPGGPANKREARHVFDALLR